jgi:hypothetical protein
LKFFADFFAPSQYMEYVLNRELSKLNLTSRGWFRC